MNKVLTINFKDSPGHWLLVEASARSISILAEGELDPAFEAPESPDTESQDSSTLLRTRLSALEKKLRSQNLTYDSLYAIVNCLQKISLQLELPFKETKALQQIILPELEDRLAIEPEAFFIQFRVMRELSAGRHEVYTNLCDQSEVEQIFAAFQAIGLRPSLLTNAAGAMTGLLNRYFLSNDKATCLILSDNNIWYLSFQSPDGNQIEEVIAPLVGEGNTQTAGQDLVFRLKQLELSHGNIEILAINKDTQKQLQAFSIETQVLPQAQVDLACNQSNLLNFGLIAAAEENRFKPILDLCFGTFANSPLWAAAVDGIHKLAPAVLSATIALVLGLSVYYFVQSSRIDHLKTALTAKIVSNLGRSDLTNVQMVSTENGILEEQLKTLGSPTGLNPADIFAQLSQDLHKETDIKFTRLKLNTNKAVLEGIAPSYSAIDRVQRILKKRSSTYCEITSRSSGAGSSPSFVIEIQLCQN